MNATRVLFPFFVLPALVLAQEAAEEKRGLERGDALATEARSAFEDGRSPTMPERLRAAALALEEARVQYLVLLEFGSPESQKTAVERLGRLESLSVRLLRESPALKGTGGSAPPGDVQKRMPIPDAAALREAERLIRDLFKEDYAKKPPPDRRSLARLLLKEAPKSKDDAAAFFVLCRDAEEAALQGGDLKTALEALDLAAQSFEMDALSLRAAALAACAKTAKAPEEWSALAEGLLRNVGELLAADQYGAAEKSAALAIQAAKSAGDIALASRAMGRSKEVAETKALFQAARGSFQTHARSPEDPAACLEVGQFLCFVKGSWEAGLELMSRGSDPALKALADLERSSPPESAGQLSVADGWFEAWVKEKPGLRKKTLALHARSWYEAAYLESTGLSRAKAEKRLGLLAPGLGLPTPSVDLLALLDLKRDTVQGDWTLDAKGLLCTRILHGSRVQIPYEPPEEYDLILVTERKEGTAPIFIGLAHGTTQFVAGIDDFAGTVTSLGSIDGKTLKEADIAVSARLLTNDTPVTVVCSLRKTEVSLSIDGKRILTFKAGYNRLTNPSNLAIPNPRALYVGCGNSRFLVSKMTLTTITGRGRVAAK